MRGFDTSFPLTLYILKMKNKKPKEPDIVKELLQPDLLDYIGDDEE